ncbi:MAG TPA: dihydropteroate synthase [Gammaproteobacteria bacterium]|nr:dihydropteroate synthase [Gammaproteobacteria bacterium]
MTILPERLRDPRPLIMGILNVTPDSFSDGGSFASPDSALAQARRMAVEGADIIDVGGESTRPGAERVGAHEQINRTQEIIRSIRRELPSMIVSIDTTLPEVAQTALEAGASMINDIEAGAEPGMLELAAARHAPIVLMHMQGTPETMQDNPRYGNVVEEVRIILLERAAEAKRRGVPKDMIILDPGIGFGKTKEHNLTLLKHLDRFTASGHPILLGASRKKFMGSICAGAEPCDLVAATCATTALGVVAGVRIFRVHDVKANRQAADVTWATLHAAS